MVKKAAIVAALALALAPATARADWLFTPNIGGAFGGDVNADVTYGLSLAWMPGGFIGAELDMSFTPGALGVGDELADVFGVDPNFFDSSASSAMGNIIVGIPFGGTTGAGFRPYASGGLGWMQVNLSDNLNDIDLFGDATNAFAVNVGGGATAFFTEKVGVRGDLRWYRGFIDDDNINEFVAPVLVDSFRNFDFWRATGGVTFRF